MNAATVTKFRFNRLEGIALSAVLQGLPTFAGAALLLKLVGSQAIGNFSGGAAVFVVSTSILYGLGVAFLAPRWPRLFQASHEPVFFDASLSIKDRVAAWLAQPKTSLQLLTNVILISLLATVLASRA